MEGKSRDIKGLAKENPMFCPIAYHTVCVWCSVR